MKTVEVTVGSAAMGRSVVRVMQRCPVTGGCPTAMSETAFARICQARRQEAAERTTMNNGYCLVCQGKTRPAELTITTVQPVAKPVEVTMKQKKGDVCASCGEPKALKSHLGEMVCSSCQLMRITCKNKPQVALQQLRKLAPGVLKGDQVDGPAEDTLLAELREILDAGDGDIVLAARRAMKGCVQAGYLLEITGTMRDMLGIDDGCSLTESVDSLINGYDRDKKRLQLVTEDRDNAVADLVDIRAALKAGDDEDLVDVAMRRMKVIERADYEKEQAVDRANRLARENEELAQRLRELRERSQAVAAFSPPLDGDLMVERVGGSLSEQDELLLDLALNVMELGGIEHTAGTIRKLRGVLHG